MNGKQCHKRSNASELSTWICQLLIIPYVFLQQVDCSSVRQKHVKIQQLES